MIFDAGNLPVVAGLFLLVLAPLALRPLLPRQEMRRERFLWAICASVSLVITVATGVSLGYLRYYHLMFLHPFAVAGLSGVVALLLGYLWRRGGGGGPKARLSSLAWISALISLCLAPAYATATQPLRPACTGGAPLTKEAGGCNDVTDAIMADHGSGLITVDNLTGPSGGADSAVSVVLDLLVRGVPEDRLYAPGRDAEMTWYWLIDRFEITDSAGTQIDFGLLASQIPDVEVLLDLQRSGELVLVVRSERGRLAIGEALCAALAPDLQLWGRTYRTWLGQLVKPGSEGIQYPEPYAPCLAQRIVQ